MNSLCYNFNRDVITSVVVQDGVFKDILISRIPSKYSKYDTAVAATESCFRLARTHNLSGEVRFRYAEYISGDVQKEIIKERASDNITIKNINTPYRFNGAVNTMYDRQEVGFATGSSNPRPNTLYTDASLVEGKTPTVSCCILNQSSEIMALFATEVDELTSIDTGELFAGLLGIKLCISLGSSDFDWICDNEYVLSVFRKEDKQKLAIETKTDQKIVDRIRDCDATIDFTSISGDDNRIADALADDVRLDDFPSDLVYTPATIEFRLDDVRSVYESVRTDTIINR